MSFLGSSLGKLSDYTIMGGLKGFGGSDGDGSTGAINSFGYSERDKNYASKTNAAIRRADWERYKTTTRPVEDRLIAMYDNPELRQAGIQNARGQVEKAFRNSGDAFEQRLAGYGLSLNPAQRQAYGRQQNLAQGLADVNAANRTNRAFDNRDMRIMTGGGQRYGLQGGG
jgi:hypothetical protein